MPEIVEEDEMTSQEHVAVGKFIPHERIVGVPSLSALEEMHQLLSFFTKAWSSQWNDGASLRVLRNINMLSTHDFFCFVNGFEP